MISKEQVVIGHQRFLAENPSAKAEVDAISQDEADALGVTLAQLRFEKTCSLFFQRARNLGIDEFEYQLQLSVDDEDERDKLRQAWKDSIDRAMGL